MMPPRSCLVPPPPFLSLGLGINPAIDAGSSLSTPSPRITTTSWQLYSDSLPFPRYHHLPRQCPFKLILSRVESSLSSTHRVAHTLMGHILHGWNNCGRIGVPSPETTTSPTPLALSLPGTSYASSSLSLLPRFYRQNYFEGLLSRSMDTLSRYGYLGIPGFREERIAKESGCTPHSTPRTPRIFSD